MGRVLCLFEVIAEQFNRVRDQSITASAVLFDLSVRTSPTSDDYVIENVTIAP
jgi:hypothetical protein